VQLRQKHSEVNWIIWFGSYVSGLPAPGSDVDLCLILSSSDKPSRERISEYLPLGFPVGIDLFAYTQAEFERFGETSPGWYATIYTGVDV
jgi:predicted nucleotidyltransferase